LSRDSYDGRASNPFSQNHYLYGNGNPLRFIDPSGHMTMIGLIGGIKNLGILATRTTISFGKRIGRAYKKKRWKIFKVELPSGYGFFEHTFIWAKNSKSKKGLGFHVSIEGNTIREKGVNLVKSARRNITVGGFFGVEKQPRINYFRGTTWPIEKATPITRLSPMAFKIWRYYATMNVREGASCNFAYNTNTNSCKHWTTRAIKMAKILTILPF